jgi:small subunit ribosomal protein S4
VPAAEASEGLTVSRYTGPRARVSRRLGTNIWGTRGETIALDRRPYPPGEHGRTRRRSNVSEYLLQLQEKQKARFAHGLTERQFRNLYDEANRRPGVTGDNMLRFLELRLDNVVYRAGWASTRPQARQFVSHGMVDVNGRRVDIPSYRLRKGDVVTLRQKTRNMIVIRQNIDVLDRTPPAWLETADGGNQVTVRELPIREQIDVPVREQLIVELYSK